MAGGRQSAEGSGLAMDRTCQVMAIGSDRRTWLRLWLLVSLLAVWPVFAGRAVFAQEAGRPEDVRIQQMRVQVMPEFDDPRVLVMVQGRVVA